MMNLDVRGYHPLWPSFPALFRYPINNPLFYQPRHQLTPAMRSTRIEGEGSGGPTTPASKLTGLGSSAFARRYLRNLFDFFSSGYLDVSVHLVPSPHPIYSGMSDRSSICRVSPFGYPRVNSSVHLTVAFRRLRVLLRYLVPRHSSYTFISLDFLSLSRVLDLRFLTQPLCNFQSSRLRGCFVFRLSNR